jgi:hypothetical protein
MPETRDRLTRRQVVSSALVAAGAGTVVGAAAFSSEPVKAQVSGLSAENVSVSGAEGRLAALTVAPDVTVEWSDLSRSVAELDVRIAASVPTGSSGEVATHTATDVSGTSGSYSHAFDEQDLLSVLDAETFRDDTEDGQPVEVGVDLSAGITFSDADGEQFGPSPVDLLGFTVSVTNVAVSQESTCRGEPSDCEGVSVSGAVNTGASAANPTD